MAAVAVWRGASGIDYRYKVQTLQAKTLQTYGNYIFAKRNKSGGWDAIYVGQGDLSTRSDIGQHHKREAIRKKGATHVHVRENPSLQSRMVERGDILDGHPEAYEPSGCNVTGRG